MRVYIVEDSELVRKRLYNMISEIKEVVIIGESDTASKAKEEIIKFKPDVVVLDIRLKQGNGIMVLEEIKKMEPKPTVIVLTNYPYMQYREASLNAGADYFFYKALDFSKVVEIIKQLTENKKRL